MKQFLGILCALLLLASTARADVRDASEKANPGASVEVRHQGGLRHRAAGRETSVKVQAGRGTKVGPNPEAKPELFPFGSKDSCKGRHCPQPAPTTEPAASDEQVPVRQDMLAGGLVALGMIGLHLHRRLA